MAMKLSLLFAVVLCALSCTTTRNYKITFTEENRESISNYLNNKNIRHNAEDIAILKDITVLSYYGQTDKLSVPEAYFFNKDGFLIKNNQKGESCGQAISKLDKILKQPVDKEQPLEKWTQNFNFLTDTGIIKDDKYDLYVIIHWAVFLDEFNGTSFNWYKSLTDNPDYKVKTILLNLDVQEEWKITPEQRQSLNM